MNIGRRLWQRCWVCASQAVREVQVSGKSRGYCVRWALLNGQSKRNWCALSMVGAQWGQHVEVRAAAARAAGGAGVLWEAHVGQNQCPGGPAGRWGVQMGCPGTEPGNSNQQPSISLEAFPAPPPTPHMPFLLT